MTLWKCFKRVWFWPVFALVLLGLSQMFWPGNKWRQIEADVNQSVTSGLQEHGIDWASVDTHGRGRDVLLSGVAPSEEDKQKAMKIAANLVLDERKNTVARIVQWEGEVGELVEEPVVELSEGNLQLTAADGRAILAGIVSSDAEKQQLEDEAKSKYGAANVVNHLTVAENIKPRSDVAGLISGFGLADGVMRVRNGKVTVTGKVDSENTKEKIGADLLSALGTDYELSNRIEVTGPSVEQICQAKVSKVMSASKVYFHISKAEIKSTSSALLDEVAAVLAECSEASVEVVGHTDSSGSEAINLPLSQARAQSVVKYLVSKNIAAERLSSVGYGSSKPIADNKTRDGRAQNRRIEFIVK